MSEILFLAHRAPWPPDRGDRIRSWHLLRALAKLAPVHVAAYADSDADAALALPKLHEVAMSSFVPVRSRSAVQAAALTVPRLAPLSNGLFGGGGMAEHVSDVIATRPITHIAVFSGPMAQFVPAGFDGRVIMDFCDVDSAKFSAYAAADHRWSPTRAVHGYEGWRLAAWEKRVARRADMSLFVSEAEAALFRARTGLGEGKVRCLENGIDLERFDSAGDWAALDPAHRPIGPLAVFTGQMDYRPNVEAVVGFAHDVMPNLRARVPDAQFAIVGRAPTAEVRALADLPGVIVTGAVDDTRSWLAAADAIVAPLIVARGVQNKLLEAMAMARPVVSSPSAATGIDAVPGRDLIVADGAQATADALAALMGDPARGLALGEAGRARMVARYSWDATLAPLAGLMGLEP
ncbi:MAG: TIGR03087 family PEP-CTERM/XrtA system glycosyltransferase [Sphingopyxis sp.]